MAPGFNHLQKVETKLEHTLAPSQLQALDLLATPLLELENHIAREIAENPVLEETEHPESKTELSWEGDKDPRSADMDGGDPARITPENTTSFDENREDFTESLEHYLEDTGSAGNDFFGVETGQDMGEEDRHRFFDSIIAEPSLQEQLLAQLRLSSCPENLRGAAEEIIGNIGESGYLEIALAGAAQNCDCSTEEIEQALKLVQTFDPPGIAARDLKECLLLQIDRNKDRYPPRLRELTEKHLEEVAKNKLPQISKEMNLPLPELQTLIGALKKLNPHPGSAAAPAHMAYVRPEVSVVSENGDFKVVPEKDFFPKLSISRTYLAMLDDPDVPEEAKAYIREKTASARQLMKNLQMRGSTIFQIAERIVSAQHDFFEHGPEALKPMTMREIADKIGRDESTVSRAISQKYMRTPRGLFPFRIFFSGGFRGENGSELSAQGIKEIIRDALAKEDPARPLSDSKIEKLLQERGFTVARRTIAKYREELGIPSSQLRKVYEE